MGEYRYQYNIHRTSHGFHRRAVGMLYLLPSAAAPTAFLPRKNFNRINREYQPIGYYQGQEQQQCGNTVVLDDRARDGGDLRRVHDVCT